MILVIDMNWKKNSLAYYEFVLPIIAITQKIDDCTVKHYLDFSKKDLNHCSRVILSGTTLEDNQFLTKIQRFDWLKTIELPVLGICAGMEAIGKVFGARLLQSLEIGMTKINTVKENLLFNGDFRAYSLHSFCVEPVSPIEVLAESSLCVQAIKHKTKPFYGVLFHPEVRNHEIISRFIQN
jgi:GMP synthase-like glutamine amidotransferase